MLNYTIFAQITIWHGDKVRASQINKIVLAVAILSFIQILYKDYKDQKQAKLDEASYAECLKKNGYDKEAKKEYDVDDLVLNSENELDCVPTSKLN